MFNAFGMLLPEQRHPVVGDDEELLDLGLLEERNELELRLLGELRLLNELRLLGELELDRRELDELELLEGELLGG